MGLEVESLGSFVTRGDVLGEVANKDPFNDNDILSICGMNWPKDTCSSE